MTFYGHHATFYGRLKAFYGCHSKFYGSKTRKEEGNIRNWKRGWLCLVKAGAFMFDIAIVNVSVETMAIGLDLSLIHI